MFAFSIAHRLQTSGTAMVNFTSPPRHQRVQPSSCQIACSLRRAAHRTLTGSASMGQQCDVVRVELSASDRSILEGDSAGFLKVCLAKESDRIPGATLVAAHAGEMIGEPGAAITNGIGLGGAGKTVHAYPTQSEVFRKATDVWRRGKLTPTAGKALRWWFKLFSAR